MFRRPGPRFAPLEIQPVVHREDVLGIEAPLDQKLAHAVGHRHVVIHAAQAELIDVAVERVAHGCAQIVQIRIGVDRGHDGNVQEPLDQNAHHVALGAVAVDDVRAEILCLPERQADRMQDAVVAAGIHRVDPHLHAFFGKHAFAEGDQAQVVVLRQFLRQGEDMGFSAADVAAGCKEHDAHKVTRLRLLRSPGSSFAGLPWEASAGGSRRWSSSYCRRCRGWCRYCRALPSR